MRRSSCPYVVAVCCAVFMFLCSFPSVGRAAAEGGNVLKIGSLVPLGTKEGMEIKKWHEVIAKMANEKGGMTAGGKKYLLQFFTYDVGYQDASKTIAAVQKAIHQDGVKYIIDNFGDVYTLTATHADQNKVLYFAVGFGDDVVGPKYQYVFRPFGGYFTAAGNYLIAQDFMKKGAKTGVVCTIDTEMGRIVAQQYAGAETMAGLKMQPPVFFGMDTVDFGPVATKIKSLNVDVVDFGAAFGDQVVSLVAALKDAGWKGFIFPGAGINPTTFNNIIKRVGSYFDGAEMYYTDPRGIPIVSKDPEMKALIDRYTKEYGEFRTEGCMWLTSWFFLSDALNATGSVDPTLLKEYLAKGAKAPLSLVGYSQLFARPDLNQYRTTDGSAVTGIGIVRDGKLQYLRQLTAKDQYLATIKFRKLQDTYQKYWDKYGKPQFANEKSFLDFSDLGK